ncbi:aromatic-ring-hydroxylating dioxygenase subunit alpha [Acidocella aquatica]|uniref:Aromatic-ring-hydroxylating dioxygenase subunit alpha n=1 Tax=Acidocella aquatica TaxID=1922313 RepID=A0ABQ6A7E2_9PROT|nr:aromatic ring-hydroxylating dioxygenase subunit alpha [Acidocella aquatica]GLR67197.1 aromatic-ring-hydroxylating dioxygenase subunit alpha [Acidocella aquatica]
MPHAIGPAVKIDTARGTFNVARRNFVDPGILQAEHDRIFDHCWLYLGHESELREPGAFLTRAVGGRNLLFTRDNQGKLNAMLNACPHRGAQVCRERSGVAKTFQCFYHGWVFGTNGALRGLPGADAYQPDFQQRPETQMTHVPRLECFRGFVFVNFDRDAVSLEDYLGNAKEYLELVADHSEAGMAIVGGTQEYAIRANWKLLAENSFDGYHAATNHATYLDYLKSTTGGLVPIALSGTGRALGNGHGVVEYKAPWGRPIAQWIPAWGEEGKARVDAIYQKLVERHGEARAERIAHSNRNLVIFPNLVVNDIMAVTVRTFYPKAPDLMAVNGWALAPQGEHADDRQARLYNFLEFLGPGGFATPDDIEALEQCQAGFSNMREAPWNDISRGMGRQTPAYDDEAQTRSFWTEWNRRLFGDQA